MDNSQTSILLIYTGGTIGMIKNPETGALESFNFDHLLNHVPEIRQLNININTMAEIIFFLFINNLLYLKSEVVNRNEKVTSSLNFYF